MMLRLYKIMYLGERDKNYNFSMMSYFIKLLFLLYKFVVLIFKWLIVLSYCCYLIRGCGNYFRLFFKDFNLILY